MSNLAQDEICGSGPHKRLGVAVVGGDVVEDSLAQMGHGLKAAATDRLGGYLGEPALDLVEPGGMSRDKVQVEAGVALQPAQDGRCLVCGIVVEHQMHVWARRDTRQNGLQEMQKLLVGVAGVAMADDL